MISLRDILRPLREALLGGGRDRVAPVRPKPVTKAIPAQRAAAAAKPARRPPSPGRRKAAKKTTSKEAYEIVMRQMLVRYSVRITRWRKSMSGIAWQVEYRDGRVENLIECPEPKSPLSMAIFLHEVGHHAIGLGLYKPRCLEEYLAWKFSMEQMEAHGLPVTDRVRTRVTRSLRYAVAKAKRRGLRQLPVELTPFDVPG